MSPTKFTEPKSGWAAECRDCPSTIEPAYGAQVFPHEEFTGDDALAGAERWAREHNAEHPQHQPSVQQFHRWTMEVTDFAPGVLEALFGHEGAAAIGVEDQDQ